MSKYKSLQPITLTNLRNQGACEPHLTEFMVIAVNDYGYQVSNVITVDDAQAIAKQIGQPKWLPEHGFIKKIEQTYHAGQKFERDGEIYTLNQCGPHELILNDENGGWWAPAVDVEDVEEITQSEFDSITISGDFKLVS